MKTLLVAAVCGSLLLTACSAGTSGEDQVVAAPPGPAASASSAPTAAPSPTPSGTVVDVVYAAGELTGVGPRVEVPLGSQVVVRLTSDVTEEIHVHGYDLYLDVPAGTTQEVAFTADLPGAYEVELHEAGRPIFQLRVA